MRSGVSLGAGAYGLRSKFDANDGTPACDPVDLRRRALEACDEGRIEEILAAGEQRLGLACRGGVLDLALGGVDAVPSAGGVVVPPSRAWAVDAHAETERAEFIEQRPCLAPRGT